MTTRLSFRLRPKRENFLMARFSIFAVAISVACLTMFCVPAVAGEPGASIASTREIIEKGFNRLATIPNDVMARQPIYLRAQEARMRDLISQEVGYRREIGKDEALDMATLNKMLDKSDKLARKDISQVVYDPVRTTATEAA